MKLIMVAIHDSKSESFGRPLFVRAYGEAERSFSEVVNDGKSDYAKHPGDFTLFEIGSYEDNTGVVTPVTPRSLGAAVTFIVTDPAQLSLLKAEG